MTDTTSTWTEDEQGFMDNGGDVGGDYQSGNAYCRRFTRQLEDGTYAVVDIYAFVEVKFVEVDEDGNVTGSTWSQEQDGTRRDVDITEMTMWTRCTDLNDVGSTETSGDVSYDHPYSIVPQDDDEAAAKAAANHIKSLSADDILWDGVSEIAH